MMTSAQKLRRSDRTSTVSASNLFGRYKREERQEVRQPDVQGQSYKDQVKRTRQMLRDMTPEQVKQVIEFHRDLNFFQAIALAKREGKLIVPNDVHDRIVTETKDETYLRENYPVWTGTLIIYEKPNKKFGDKVVFTWEDDTVKYSISFKVPEQFRVKANCVLVVEHPDFELVSLGNNRYELRVSDEANVNLIKAFPKKNDWYLSTHGIPVGEVADSSNNNARYLWRDSNNYSGPVVRGYNSFVDDNGRFVLLVGRPSGGCGVALVPLAAVPEKDPG